MKRTQAGLDRNAGALKEDGLPDSFNRLLGTTPEKLDAMKEASMAQKIGPREQALRAMREAGSKPVPVTALKKIVEAPAPMKKDRPAPAATEPKPEAPAPDKPKEMTAMDAITETAKTKTTRTERRAASAKKADKRRKTAKAKTAKKATPKKKQRAPKSAADGPREGSKLAIIDGLLKRKEGCTTKDVLAATGWPAVSMPQQAKALGITLRKEKDGSASRYYAA